MIKKFRNAFDKLLSSVGIEINGENPWDVQIHDERVYKRVLVHGSVGLGESYMDGWWDCNALDEATVKLLSQLNTRLIQLGSGLAAKTLISGTFSIQSKMRAFRIGKVHYDLGNDLFQNILDKQLIYSCGYWKKATNLDEAQEAKLDLVCKKLGLNAGEKVLDIGCGWGGFLKFAAKRYNVKGIGITVSKEQVELGRKLCRGLPIEIRFQDYRDLDEKFDHIVSIGMFEHVDYKNYRNFIKVAHECLRDNGLFLLHTIGSNVSTNSADPWINKYIFPQSMIPSIKQVGASVESLFVMEDWHNFGADYDKTLMAWYRNFEKNWGKIKTNYDERFFRTWRYFLLTCAGSFRVRRNQLWQIILSKKGVKDGYKSIR